MIRMYCFRKGVNDMESSAMVAIAIRAIGRKYRKEVRGCQRYVEVGESMLARLIDGFAWMGSGAHGGRSECRVLGRPPGKRIDPPQSAPT